IASARHKHDKGFSLYCLSHEVEAVVPRFEAEPSGPVLTRRVGEMFNRQESLGKHFVAEIEQPPQPAFPPISESLGSVRGEGNQRVGKRLMKEVSPHSGEKVTFVFAVALDVARIRTQ